MSDVLDRQHDLVELANKALDTRPGGTYCSKWMEGLPLFIRQLLDSSVSDGMIDFLCEEVASKAELTSIQVQHLMNVTQQQIDSIIEYLARADVPIKKILTY